MSFVESGVLSDISNCDRYQPLRIAHIEMHTFLRAVEGREGRPIGRALHIGKFSQMACHKQEMNLKRYQALSPLYSMQMLS